MNQEWMAMPADMGSPLWLRHHAGKPPKRYWAEALLDGGWWVQGPGGQTWHVPQAGGHNQIKPSKQAQNEVLAPMSGCVVALDAQDGDAVVEGQVLMHLEAMKLRMPLVAPCTGLLRLAVSKGAQVQALSLLLRVEPLPSPASKA